MYATEELTTIFYIKKIQHYSKENSPIPRISGNENQPVSLNIFDLPGSEVATLVNEEKLAGTYEITWNAENIPAGVYFCRLQSGSFAGIRKMVLMK